MSKQERDNNGMIMITALNAEGLAMITSLMMMENWNPGVTVAQ